MKNVVGESHLEMNRNHRIHTCKPHAATRERPAPVRFNGKRGARRSTPFLAFPLSRFRVATVVTVLFAFVFGTVAAERTLSMSGVPVTLQDLSAEVDVFYTSMRFNRALNVWNVELTVRNNGSRTLSGPFAFYVESFAGTTGLLQPDGTDSGNAYLDLSGSISSGTLAPNQTSAPRTLTLGSNGGTPQLNARVYGNPQPAGYALALTRSLNEVGQPLPGVTVEETSSAGTNTNATDLTLGLVTLGRSTGNHVWKFTRPGYMPVWRSDVLQSNTVTLVPNPRLTPRATNATVLTSIAGGVVNGAGIAISFAAGTFAQNTIGTLTRLTGQTLPGLLPLGWSPIQAFWLDLSTLALQPGSAAVTPWARLNAGETATLVRWNEVTLTWDAQQNHPGSTNLSLGIPGAGIYAVVVPDSGTYAPPAPTIGQPLPGTTAPFSIPTSLTALGTLTPSLSPASRNPDLVTAAAEVTITNTTGALPSGLVLRCEVTETYDLADTSASPDSTIQPLNDSTSSSTRRVLPRYETFIVAYQRGTIRETSDNDAKTVTANFPVRPLLLLGGEELKQGNVRVDVLAPSAFGGGVFDERGGQVSAGGVRVLAPAGVFTNRLAINLGLLDSTNFLSIAGSNVVYAFELSIGSMPAGQRLTAQFNAQSANSFFVLSRVVSRQGYFGLEPIERYASDATGRLSSVEPTTGERLPGITSGGQFVLSKVSAAQGIVRGTTRNGLSQPAAGLVVRVTGQPWLVFSADAGAYRTLSPQGPVDAVVTDPVSGDIGSGFVSLSNWQASVVLDLSAAPAGPRIVSISPTNTATNVALVASVTITFSEPLNIGSAVGGIILLGQSNLPVNAALNFNLRGNVVTLLPTDALAPNTLHTVLLSTNIADPTGMKLEGSSAFSFRTRSDTLDRGLGAIVTSYEPTNGVARIVGSQGIADPGVPVILVNDTTSETSTTISKPDGSFDDTIRAGADDYISAVFVNLNGTRNIIPVSKQIYRDGSVGLFNGGGMVEVASPQGSIQLTVEPGSIANKTIIKAEYVAPTNYPANVTNTPPEDGGKLVGAFKFSGRGDEVAQGIDVSFPVKVEDLGLPQGVHPTNASFALVIAREYIDDLTGETNTAYEIIDRMHYENGRLVTHSPPFLGLLISLVVTHEIVVYTALQATGGTIAIAGNVLAGKLSTTPNKVQEGTERYLYGATVVAVPPGVTANRPGSLRPGTFYATASGTNAHFATIVPFYANGAVTMWATHPRFPGQHSESFTVPALSPNDRFLIGNILYPTLLIFPLQIGNELDDRLPPSITFSHAPDAPQPGTNMLRVLSRDDGARPTIEVTVEAVTPLFAGTNVAVNDISLTRTNSEDIGTYGKRDWFQVVCPVPAKVDFKAISRDASGNERTGLYSMIIGGPPITATNSIPVVDPHDKTGPLVIRSIPTRGSRGLPPGQPIVLRFDEPIDRAVLTTRGAVLLSPATAGTPTLTLSPDQLELTIFVPDLAPNTDYTLTLTAEIKDIAGNRLDQFPILNGNDSFELTFHTAELPITPFPGVQQGGGVVTRGIYAYVLERGGTRQGVMIYDLSNPAAPVKVSEYITPGFPRDLTLIPNYSYRTNENGPVLTRDLLAVVGGFVGAGRSQYLRVLDISDPLAPLRVAGATLNYDPSAVASRVQWSAPMLDYLENATLSAVHEVTLQEAIIANFMSFSELNDLPANGRVGADLNHDGDFVDDGDVLPLPPRVSPDFAGKSGIYTLGETDQWINDFAMGHGGNFVAVVADAGKNTTNSAPVHAAYRTLIADGRLLIREAASYEFTNARPKRVALLLDYEQNVNGVITPTHYALISLRMNAGHERDRLSDSTLQQFNDSTPPTNRIVVLNVTDPEDIQFVTEIGVPAANGDAVFGITRREDGLLLVATSKDVLLLDPARFRSRLSSDAAAIHPAIVGILPGGGEAMRTFDGNLAGLNVASMGGKNVLLQSAPLIQVVSFPETAPFNPRDLVNTVRTNIEARFAFMTFPTVLPPGRFKGEPGVLESTITPPDAHFHYNALIHAPGSAGEFIELALESLNWSGNPLAKKGFLFPPINALSDSTIQQLNGSTPPTDATTRSCRAWRLSHDPASPYYNLYLSRPFALVTEEMSVAELNSARQAFDREILWSGDYLRVSIDPSMSQNPVLGRFAGQVDGRERANIPGVETILPTHPADYIQSQNPGPIAGGAMLPSAMNALRAHSGEMNINLECLNLPGRRLPIIFRLNYSGQSLYEGPFSRGWDFNYNQRVEELNETLFAAGSKIPLVIRDSPTNSEIAQSKDLIFHTGAGRKAIYKFAGTNAPAEIAADPLVAELGWTNTVARYYLPPDGLFNFFVKFKDGRFARLDTDGTQHWYNPAGKLVKVYDRYPENSIEMVYSRRGDLIQIKDELRRPIDIGYYRSSNDPDFRSGIDRIATRTVEFGKICRLADYSKRDLLFYYNDQGLLEKREGPRVEAATTGSFTGRAITRFLYSGTDQPGVSAQSLIGMIGADDTGTPVVSATELGSQGRDAVDKLKVANREVSIEMAHQNTAASLAQGNGSVEVTAADQSKVQHTFDKFGRPIQTKFTGTNGAPRINSSTYYPNGLLKTMTYPEGNSITYIYDTNNPVLRSRGNLTMVIRNPGPRGGPILTANTQFDSWYNLAAGIKKDFNGVEAQVILRPDHRDVQEIRIGGHAEKFFADDFGMQTKYIGIDGVEQSWTYTTDGFIDTVTAGSGATQLTTRYSYSTAGSYVSDQTKRGIPSAIEDPKGVRTSLVYDEQNRLVSSTRAGVTTTHSYDASGNETETSTTVDTNLSLVERFGYNQLGFLTNHTVQSLEIEGGVANKTTTMLPDEFSRVRETILPSGDRHRLSYDHMGNVIAYQIVGPDEAVVYAEEYGYDLNGNRTSKTIAGVSEHYEYDGHDRMKKVTTPSGTVVESVFDNNGNPLEVTTHDNQGRLLSKDVTTYDELNRPRTVKRDRDGGVSQLTYDFNSQQRSATITDPLGAQMTTYYDLAGRPERVETATKTNYYHYDSNDNLEREELVEGGATYLSRWERNERDHVVRAFDNLGRVTQFGVRLDGVNTTITDRENHTTTRQLSRIGEVLAETNPNGVIKRFTIGTNGMLSTVRDTAFNGVSYSYSPDGRLLETRLPNNATITCSDFNPLSLPQKIEMPRGVTIATTYSPIGKTLTRTVTGLGPARVETYGYDGLQRLTSLTDPSGSMQIDFDVFGFLKETRRSYVLADAPSGNSALNFSIGQTPDEAGRVKSQTYPSNVVVTHHRDITGRLVGLETSAGEPAIKDTRYFGDLRIGQRILGDNRVQVENSYDPLRRLAGRKYTRIADGQLLAEVRYAFDKNGAQAARQFVHRGGRADFFAYDDGYRLTRVDQDVRPQLDGATEPNRTLPNFAQPTYVDGQWRAGRFARELAYTTTDVIQSLTVYNPDQLPIAPMGTNYESPDIFRHVPAIDGFTRERDVVGNVTKTRLAVRLPGQVQPQLVEAALTYNDLGQCTKIARADGVEILNDYDMAGLRIRRRVAGNAARCVPSDVAFIYDGAKLIEERDLTQGARIIARYYYGDDADELVAADLLAGSNTNLTRHYFLCDVMRSVMAVTDAEGHVVERINYDAFGQPSAQFADNQLPAISRVLNETNSILVAFTEPVLPGFASTPAGSNLVTTLKSLNNAFQLMQSNTPVSFTVTFEENFPVFPFGSVFRLRPSQTLNGTVTLRVAGASFLDEWNNTNGTEVVTLDLGTTNTVLFAGPSPGSTAPIGIARSISTLLFHGQVFDFDSGLLYCRSRYYDPTTASFLQRDPAGFEDSVNQYAAFANNPINFRDPTGAFAWDPDSWGRSLSEIGGQASIKQDGLSGYMVGSMISFAGAVLQLGTAFAEGWDLLHSDAQGTFGLLDRIHGAKLIASDVSVAAGAAGSMYSVFSGITGRVRGYISDRRQWREFSHNNGLTAMEADAKHLAMREMAQIYKARSVEVGVRRFKKPIQRRQNAERLMANKPGHVLDKTGEDGWVYKDGKFYNSDADLAYMELDGRPTTLAQQEHFNRLVKKHYEDLYRKAGYKGTPSSPVQHGMHERYPDLQGQIVNTHLVDHSKLAKVGHCGDVFSLKFEDGRMSGFHKSRWEIHNKFLESEKRYMAATGMRLPQEWTQMSLHPTIGSIKDAARAGKVFTPKH